MENYFESTPEYGIASKIENEVIPRGIELMEFISEVETDLENMEEQETETFINQRDKGNITYKDTYNLFRKKEKLNNTRLMIQYLISFTEKLPMEGEIKQLPVNPFAQFKEFVMFMLRQFREDEVVNAVLREYEELDLLTDKNSWYYKGKIRYFYDNIFAGIKDIKEADHEGYKKLFNALKKYSLFWFGIRRENLNRIRKSDLNIYKLVRILLSRLSG